MNILVAKKVAGAFQKVGVFIPNEQFISDPAGDFLSFMGYRYFKDEPAASSIDIVYDGIDYRISKF
jgi:hypothetical protein